LAEFLERAEREQTNRRRRGIRETTRPFGLPPRLHLLEEEVFGPGPRNEDG
jgi:hypothetical protein